MSRKILVAIDGSDAGNRALAFAVEYCSKVGGDLTIMHVLMHGKPAEELERLAVTEHLVKETASRILPDELNLPPSLADVLAHPEADMARAVAEIGDYLVQSARLEAEEAGAQNVRTRIERGDYADAILDVASDIGVDLLVMGRRGLGRIGSLFLGSVSNKVLQHAQCTVTVVR
ncbi:universal stress protein [Roseibium sp.]|uniref:universal stress protein n=1 Tax=Roseibium sp. TaxID=1936156 RepID=UPI003D11AAB8